MNIRMRIASQLMITLVLFVLSTPTVFADDDQQVSPVVRRVIGYMSQRPVHNIDTSVTQSDLKSINKKLCSTDQLITQNLKSGARNGEVHSFTKGVVTEVKILQSHMNRLGFNSGPVDGTLGPLTRGLLNTSCGENGLS